MSTVLKLQCEMVNLKQKLILHIHSVFFNFVVKDNSDLHLNTFSIPNFFLLKMGKERKK